jgi:hypothetical protein
MIWISFGDVFHSSKFHLTDTGVTKGDMGFAEAYLAGDVECDDLTGLFKSILFHLFP